MEFLQGLYISDLLHTISSDLLIPVVVLLMLFIVYSVYSIGSIVVEAVGERRRYSAYIPEVVAALDAAELPDVGGIIEESGLLRVQKDDLLELATYLYLPQDARTEVAKRLLANEERGYQKAIARTDVAAKVAPMLGLMGTLIPLGPGIVALGTGDVETLSGALLMAFDTTVAGLATAVVCFVITRLRQGWYGDYLVSMEAAFNTLLEKAQLLHDAGYEFPRLTLRYDNRGRRAQLVREAAAPSASPSVSEGLTPSASPSAPEGLTPSVILSGVSEANGVEGSPRSGAPDPVKEGE